MFRSCCTPLRQNACGLPISPPTQSYDTTVENRGQLHLNRPSDQLSPRTLLLSFIPTLATMLAHCPPLTSAATIPPPHEPPTARFLSPFIFITLQIPIPANPLYSHPYKTPGVSPSSIAHPRFSPPFHSLARSLSLLPLFFHTPVLCFQSFARSFTKTPGVGGLRAHRDTSTSSFEFAKC